MQFLPPGPAAIGLARKFKYFQIPQPSQAYLRVCDCGMARILAGGLAGHFWIGVPKISGQNRSQDPSRSPGLTLHVNLHE